jgi:hypothetical protein
MNQAHACFERAVAASHQSRRRRQFGNGGAGPLSGRMQILNTPSDGHERAVANTLGISVDAGGNP